ncbi:MAG: signal peptidase I, partial [Opitutales bacterium]|nr:signal peptidase I [Opitutales bacterium]
NALLRSDKLVSKNGELWFDMGKKKAGESVLSFDILGGDMLFVDRFTYNFRKPKAGEPFVFRTSMCEGITQQNGGIPDDKYYIKRIAGVGGDELKVENFALYRNGSPAAGAEAFKMNAGREGEYCGYRNEGAFSGGKSVKVPAHSYYALGDNSANSLDSRYWGRVPEKAVVGRPLVVFYPFTQRWGSAK